jgi:hypothetical protein
MGIVSLASPYENGDSPFPYGDWSIPISIWRIPIWKRGSFHWHPHMETGIPHFHMGIGQSPFPYGESPYGNGDRFIGIPIWKWGFPISIWGCVNPRMEMGIVSLESPYGNRESPFPYGDVLIRGDGGGLAAVRHRRRLRGRRRLGNGGSSLAVAWRAPR